MWVLLFWIWFFRVYSWKLWINVQTFTHFLYERARNVSTSRCFRIFVWSAADIFCCYLYVLVKTFQEIVVAHWAAFVSDVNECDKVIGGMVSKGGCHHKCENTIGSYTCSCNKGYSLADDKKTCKGRVKVLTNELHVFSVINQNYSCEEILTNFFFQYYLIS